MKKLSIREAALMLQTSEQGVRELIKKGAIKGAAWYGSEKHRNYYITDGQITAYMKGE